VQNGENVPYFHGALSDEQTDLLLKKEGAGAFLVRNNAAQNCLILSYVNNSNAVTHLRLWRQPDGRYCLRNPPSASDSMHQSVDRVRAKQAEDLHEADPHQVATFRFNVLCIISISSINVGGCKPSALRQGVQIRVAVLAIQWECPRPDAKTRLHHRFQGTDSG